MAFAKHPISPQQTQPTIDHAPKEYVTPVVDTRAENYNTLATFAAGSKWACDFFIQKVAKDTAPGSYTADQLPIYGQYTRVRGFELLVTSPINPQQDTSLSRSFTVTGSASVYSVITPNEGDLFIADIGDGRNGLFMVTRSVRSAPYTESMIAIDFRMLSLMTQMIEDDLTQRVVDVVFFDRELLRSGVNPMIKSNAVDVNRRLIKAYRRLTNSYIHEFFDTEFNTLLVPGQLSPTYDPHMTRFVLRVLDKSVCNALGRVLELGVSHKVSSRVLTLLDALERVDVDVLYSVATKGAIAGRSHYRTRPYLHSIYNSGIAQVVVVLENGYTRDTADDVTVGIGAVTDAGVRRTESAFLLPTIHGKEALSDQVGLIKSVSVDDYYIFSDSFYNDTEGQSALERIVRARLSHEAISLEELASIAEATERFDNLERFYYIPIILAMIKLSPGVL